MGVKNKGFSEAAKRIANEQIVFNRVAKKYAKIMSAELKRIAVNNTPVVTGELQGAWETKPVEVYPKKVNAGVINEKDYGPSVEYGHRLIIRKKYCGYVAGQYFFRRSLNEFAPIFSQMSKDFQKEINEELGGK